MTNFDLDLCSKNLPERTFDRTLTQLEWLERMRLGQSATPPIKLRISSR
jgi:hypothetical protein